VHSRLPLSALLPQALLAFTIELDNEFERRMPHRTANHGKTAGDLPTPWLGSFVLWANFLRFVDPAGARSPRTRGARRRPRQGGVSAMGPAT
jgi:hypothetical protein